MSNSSCTTCSKSKAPLTCGICQDVVCKQCTQFVEENHFSFLKKIPAELQHTSFCPTCYVQKVEPELQAYDAMMEKARNTLIFMKAQHKETRFVKRLEEPVQVIECADRDETVLRLAFLAAQRDFNGVIDIDITSKKIRSGNYQTTVFSGTGIPANVREDKLIKDRSNWSSPN